MTALNFYLREDEIFIVTDTLSLHGLNKKPIKYASKMFSLPHLKGVLCGTGNYEFIHEWFYKMQMCMHVEDLLHADCYSTDALINLGEECGIDEHNTVTVYHFGYSEAEGRYLGFAYRSTRQFQSERLTYGNAVKPPLEPGVIDSVHREAARYFIEYMNDKVSAEEMKAEEFSNSCLSATAPFSLLEFLKRQREADRLLPIKDRVGIGGEVHLAHLKDGVISIECLHRFDDYDDIFKEMLDNQRSDSSE